MEPADPEGLFALWLADVEAALGAVGLDPGDVAYAIAFWLFYAERGAVIFAPCVGLGTERGWKSIRAVESVGFGSARWNPADWAARHAAGLTG